MTNTADTATETILQLVGSTNWYGVPDSRLAPLLEATTSPVEIAPREDLAVAMAFGHALVGKPPVIFMKDAGLGHSLDALLTTFTEGEQAYVLLLGTTDTQAVPRHHREWQQALPWVLKALGIGRWLLGNLVNSPTQRNQVRDALQRGIGAALLWSPSERP